MHAQRTAAGETKRSVDSSLACAARARAASHAHATIASPSTRGFDLSIVPASVSLQRKPALSEPGDALEREADVAADRVMRMADAPATTPASAPSLQRKCTACQDDERRIHARRESAAPASADADTATAARVASRGGAPLPDALRGYYEPRFGHDFSHVRVHTDAEAAHAARDVGAQAYTFGHHIVFGGGRYAPSSTAGRHLIAHELAHVVQQGSRGASLQRKLLVDEKASDDPKTASATIDALIGKLCPDFEVAKGGLVTPKKGSDCASFKFGAIAKGKQKLGCCCLCTLTAAPDTWRVVVSINEAPTTDSAKREVRMTPTSGAAAPDLRYWTAGPTQTVKAQAPAEAFGHELCGHAALMQIKAHPSSLASTPDRAFSDVHDPTVRVQDALGKEMGLPGDRGLAGGGSHRGESLRVFTIGPFAADADDPSPFAAQIKAAVDFMNGNANLFVDAVGLRDAKDKKPSVSGSRASKVQAELKKGVKALTTKVKTTPKGPEETLDRVQPSIDGGSGASPIVDLRMAFRPAGLVSPVGKAPPATPVHVDPEFPAVVKALKAGGKGTNECHKLLSDTAWP